VSVLAIVLVACAVLVVIGAEWPRLSARARAGGEGRARKERDRRKAKLRVVDGGEHDDFAESVQRDLDRLPVIEEHDDRPHR
jgi:hypothetical protein